jgi:hypothetical protein
MNRQARVPAGVPTGGQFAPASRPEASGIELSDEDLVEVVGDDAHTMPELEPEEGLTINLSAELIDRCGNTFRRGMFGPEGFTIGAAPALQRFTSQRYVPHAYREFGTGALHVNGAMGGLFYFSGADGESAAELLATLPSKCLDNRQNNAPTLRNILSAATSSGRTARTNESAPTRCSSTPTTRAKKTSAGGSVRSSARVPSPTR